MGLVNGHFAGNDTERDHGAAAALITRIVIRCSFQVAGVSRLKVSVLIALLCLSGCSWLHTSSWFHSKKSHAPEPTELIVTGAPSGSFLFIDGVQAGEAKEVSSRPQVVDVTPGSHTVEVKVGEAVAYRENTFVAAGDKLVITVLSGANRK